jgi:protein-disulfide isomerase
MENNKNITVWFIVGFVVLAVGGVSIAYVMSGGTGSLASSANPGFVATTVPAITSADWTEGNPKAKVSLIEYGDFECPACGEYEPIVEQIVNTYGNSIFFAFRNFPLYTIHPDAGISAQAAEAAGSQGKYWQMHDLLYKNQATWTSAASSSVVQQYFDGYASSLGLNVDKFNQDINGSQVAAKIQADVSGGNGAQIDHTPTFFVNLTQIPNPMSYSEFKSVIDKALAAASGTTP